MNISEDKRKRLAPLVGQFLERFEKEFPYIEYDSSTFERDEGVCMNLFIESEIEDTNCWVYAEDDDIIVGLGPYHHHCDPFEGDTPERYAEIIEVAIRSLRLILSGKKVIQAVYEYGKYSFGSGAIVTDLKQDKIVLNEPLDKTKKEHTRYLRFSKKDKGKT